ncbi:hypothetical protein HAX54_044414, partial [Datura stramonium]|nr:hypothetical protein [Datura stramonium]
FTITFHGLPPRGAWFTVSGSTSFELTLPPRVTDVCSTRPHPNQAYLYRGLSLQSRCSKP